MSGGFLRLLAAVAGALLLPASAFAACTVPAGIAGDIMYNSTYNVLQFCNGTSWINAGSSNASGIGTLTSGDFCTTDGTNINCTTASPLPAASGGTGVANSNTITLGGNVSTAGAFTTSGANALTLTTTGATNVTLPTSGTLVTTGVTTLSSLVSIGTITTGVWNGTGIAVPYGGTGAATFTSNGVLYGNSTSAIQVTAQGAANSVLTANAGAPSFSASPTVGTSVTTPLAIGGTAASSTLTLESTSGTGTSDAILFKTASQSERMRIDTSGNVGIGTTAPLANLQVSDQITLIKAGTGFYELTRNAYNNSGWKYIASDYAGMLEFDNAGDAYFATAASGTAGATITWTIPFFIKNNGNVGIGSTSPTSKLQILSTSAYNSNTNVALKISDSATPTKALQMGYDTSLDAGYIQPINEGVAFKNLILNPSSGNVGIGTTTPDTKLHVFTSNTNTNLASLAFADIPFALRNSSATNNNLDLISFQDSSGSGNVILGAVNTDQTNHSGDFVVLTNNLGSRAERLRITGAGNVGIGTTAPQGTLMVTSSSAATAIASLKNIVLSNSSFTNNNTEGIVGQNSVGGNVAGIDFVNLNQVTDGSGASGGINFWTNVSGTKANALNIVYGGNVGIGTTSPAALTHISGAQSWASLTTNPMGAQLIIDAGASTDRTYIGSYFTGGVAEASAIQGSAYYSGVDHYYNLLLNPNGGNVGIGVTGPTHLLQLNADDGFKPNGGSWGNSSDERLKTNIQPVTDALGKIAQLSPVLFEWKNPSLHGGKAASGGFIAQQLKQVFPDFVTQSDCVAEDCKLTGGEKEYGMQLPFTFDAYLVKAIQELKADNDNLRREVAALRREVRRP